MMTVERLFASILGSAFSIRSVELWDGEVPEALLQKVQEEEKNAKTSKTQKASTAKTRRRSKTETGGNTNGEGSSKHANNINGGGALHHLRNKSEGTQTLPRTAEGGTQTEEPCPPNSETVVDSGSAVSKPTEEPSSPRPSGRDRIQRRSESMASDVSMSGAVQEAVLQNTVPPSSSRRKQRSGTNDSGMSTGAHTEYTTASETLERQDSGFETVPPPVQSPDRAPDNVAEDEIPRRGLQAPPILPTETSRSMKLRGGVSPDDSPDMSFHGDSEDPDRTPRRDPPQDRRSSYQNVPKIFGKKFGRSSSKAPSHDDNHGIPPTGLDGRRPFFRRRRSSAVEPPPTSSRAVSSSNAQSQDDNHGIPPTGLNGRRPLFDRRRSSAIEAKPPSSGAVSSSHAPSQDDNYGIPPTGLNGRRPKFDRHRSSAVEPRVTSSGVASSSITPSGNAPSGSSERPSSSIRTGTATSQTREKFTKENNYGIPPGGLDDKRPLSFIRKFSSQAPEPEESVAGPSSSRRSSGAGDRPLSSILRRSKGKAPEEPEQFTKENNFGIPHTGL